MYMTGLPRPQVLGPQLQAPATDLRRGRPEARRLEGLVRPATRRHYLGESLRQAGAASHEKGLCCGNFIESG